MTIHPDMIRAMLAHGGDLQSAYVAAWAENIPEHLRKHRISPVMRELGRKGGEAVQAKARRVRDKISPQVMALHREGMSGNRIAATLGIGRELVRRIISEAEA